MLEICAPALWCSRGVCGAEVAGIEPYGRRANRSLATRETTDPRLVARARTKARLIRRAHGDLSQRMAMIPLVAREPIGAAGLRALARAEAEATASLLTR